VLICCRPNVITLEPTLMRYVIGVLYGSWRARLVNGYILIGRDVEEMCLVLLMTLRVIGWIL
jgi:hypothetical protein